MEVARLIERGGGDAVNPHQHLEREGTEPLERVIVEDDRVVAVEAEGVAMRRRRDDGSAEHHGGQAVDRGDAVDQPALGRGGTPPRRRRPRHPPRRRRRPRHVARRAASAAPASPPGPPPPLEQAERATSSARTPLVRTMGLVEKCPEGTGSARVAPARAPSALRGGQLFGRVPEIFEGREQPVDVVLEGDVALDVALGQNATRLGNADDLELGSSMAVVGRFEQRTCHGRPGCRALGSRGWPPSRIRHGRPRAIPWQSGHTGSRRVTANTRRT